MRAPAFWWRERGWQAALLAPLGAVYGVIAALRLGGAGFRAGIPVICIGNPTVGGAGKTPAAIAVAEILRAGGRCPFFLSRGYGGRQAGPVQVDIDRHRAADVGDEPLLLARVAPTIVARDRAAGARVAEKLGANVVVMDDGFQNPSLAKDISILVIDGGRGVGNGCILPAGPLRAPLRAQLARAHALLMVGAAARAPLPSLAEGQIELPLIRAEITPDQHTVTHLRGRPLLAFCGIGDPQRFRATLDAAGLDVRDLRAFPDHHPFTRREAEALLAEADARGLTLITTEKDFVRLSDAPEQQALRARVQVLPIRLSLADQSSLVRLISSSLCLSA